MGLLTWIMIAVVILVLYLYIRTWFVGSRGKEIPFIGLGPLTGPLKKSRKYFDEFMSGLLDDEELSPPDPPKLKEVAPPAKVNIPTNWDFRDIVGDRKRERITRRVLETLYDAEFPTVRPDWLINPRTGRRLEIDLYNEELGLCCEVSGAQHYEQSERFHRTREEFIEQVYRDKVKKEQILARGLDFIVVPYTVPTLEIPSYIQQMLRQLGRV